MNEKSDEPTKQPAEPDQSAEQDQPRMGWSKPYAFEQIVYQESADLKKKRSDHCPIAVTLDLSTPGGDGSERAAIRPHVAFQRIWFLTRINFLAAALLRCQCVTEVDPNEKSNTDEHDSGSRYNAKVCPQLGTPLRGLRTVRTRPGRSKHRGLFRTSLGVPTARQKHHGRRGWPRTPVG